jgi:hypothetical protein
MSTLARPASASIAAEPVSPLVAVGEETLEQQAEQLQRDILERQCRPMEQLQQPVLRIELNQRRHRAMAEAPIGCGAQLAQIVVAQRTRDERPHHRHRRVDIGQPGQRLDLVQ